MSAAPALIPARQKNVNRAQVCDENSHNPPATTWLRRRVGKENRAKLLSR